MFKMASTAFFNRISNLLSSNKDIKLEDSLCKIHSDIYSPIRVDSLLEKWDKSVEEWKSRESPSDNGQLTKFFQPSETCYDKALRITFANFELSILNWFFNGKCTPPKFFFPGLVPSSKPIRNFQEISKVIAVLNNSLADILVSFGTSLLFIQLPYLTVSNGKFTPFFRAHLAISDERASVFKFQRNVLLDAVSPKSIPVKPSDSLSKAL